MSNSIDRSTWQKVKALGKGGFATVFLAQCTDRNSLFAVKTAKLEDSDSLIRESKILEQFKNCPEIVKIYGHEITIEKGLQYYNLFLEYAPAGDLLDLMAKAGGRTWQENIVRGCTRMILEGLSRIHAKGIVHCDIKPENILVFPSPLHGYRLKLSDFGLAKEPDEEVSVSKKYRFRGTPAYMSPESVALGEIGTAMDIWSLGCLVLVMITGTNPWRWVEGLDPEKILSLLAFTEMMPEIPTDISETGRDFLRRCLQRDPKKRWSAQKLLDHPFVTTATTKSNVSTEHHQMFKLPHEYQKIIFPRPRQIFKLPHEYFM